MNGSTGSMVPTLVLALVIVLGVCAGLVGVTAVTHTGSNELTVSVIGLGGVIVSVLVGLLNAQLVALHTTVNSRMDELVSATRQAAFARGQAAEPGAADMPNGPKK